MIIFESLLTNFEQTSCCVAAGAIAKIDLSLKPNRYDQVKQFQLVEINVSFNVSEMDFEVRIQFLEAIFFSEFSNKLF